MRPRLMLRQKSRCRARSGWCKGQDSGGQHSQGELLLPMHCLVWETGRGVDRRPVSTSEEAGGLMGRYLTRERAERQGGKGVHQRPVDTEKVGNMMGRWSPPSPCPHLDVPVGNSVHGDGVQQGGVQLLDVGGAVHLIHEIPDGGLGLQCTMRSRDEEGCRMEWFINQS